MAPDSMGVPHITQSDWKAIPCKIQLRLCLMRCQQPKHCIATEKREDRRNFSS